jgi:hypothetical protein
LIISTEKLLLPTDDGVENTLLGLSDLIWFQLLTKLSTRSVVDERSKLYGRIAPLSTECCLDRFRYWERSTISNGYEDWYFTYSRDLLAWIISATRNINWWKVVLLLKHVLSHTCHDLLWKMCRNVFSGRGTFQLSKWLTRHTLRWWIVLGEFEVLLNQHVRINITRIFLLIHYW